MGVEDRGDTVSVAGYPLLRIEAQNLRDYLTEWLGDAEAPAHDCVLMDCAATARDRLPTCCNGEDSSPCCPTVVPDTAAPLPISGNLSDTILREAQAAVYGDRQVDYGHPRRNFTRTAIGWQMVLMDKLADGESITPEDVALCMVQVKVAREVHEPKRDNRVDGAGYFETLDRLETGR